MERYFKGFTVQHIPRKENTEADKLAKAASNKEQLPPEVFFETPWHPSIKPDLQPMSLVNAISSERLEGVNNGLPPKPHRAK